MDLGAHVVDWRPGPVTSADELPPGQADALSAVFDRPPAEGVLPPLWHWLYFLDWPAHRDLGEDGHPRAGHFLPPIPDRRRMFAGGRLEVHRPLALGTPAERVSSLGEIAVKQGSTGEMMFVTVRHEISQGSRLCVVDEQDIVYRSGEDEGRRGMLSLSTDEAPASDAAWQLALRPDSRLLFRISALTANAHRIHYDEPYVRDVEGYPGLVVHGPLLVLLMLELVRDKQIRSLSYRLRSPVFAGEHLRALGSPENGGASLRIATAREERNATAEVSFA
jgi:hydroxyacyl-ACP dehydratase HTD2-like protein with hotdog domain